MFTGVVRHQPGERRADPGVDRRLRADGLRHRRDHGRAVRRPARLRVRPEVRPADPGDPAPAGRVVRRAARARTPTTRAATSHVGPARAFVGDAPYVNSAERRRSTSTASTPRPRRSQRRTPGWRPTAAARRRSPTSCATGCSAASATGVSRSRSCTTPTGSPHALPDDMLPVLLPETDSFSPRTFDPDDEFSDPERPLDRLGEWVKVDLDLGDGPQRVPPRHQRDAAVGRLVLVRAALPRPDQRRARSSTREVERYWMGPRTDVRPDHPGRRRPVRRRRRARRAAPAVRPLLAQGAVRPRPPVSSKEPYARLFNQGYIQAVRLHRRARRVRRRDGRRRARRRVLFDVRRRARSPASTARWARA